MLLVCLALVLFALRLIVMIRESGKQMTSVRAEKPEGGGGRGALSSAYGDVPIAMKRAPLALQMIVVSAILRDLAKRIKEMGGVSPGDWFLQKQIVIVKENVS